MASPSWLVDKSRIATKIKSASGACDPEKVVFKSNPTKACPNCQHTIDNSDVAQKWPGLPKGVKFDPSDQDIISHLIAKVGEGNSKPHPFIDEFITTIEGADGICYTHPKNLDGVKQDGSISHFFHRAIKAYNTGSRKRRKIQGCDSGDVRWHKTGKTKQVKLDGVTKGYKKIMVLYASKTDKTNWVMHQYHLGTEQDEKDGEYVISKVFYQQDKFGDKDDDDISEATEATILNVDPNTPKSVTPVPPCNERPCSDVDLVTPKSTILNPPGNERSCSDVDLGQGAHLMPQLECLDEIIADCEVFEKTDASIVETEDNKGMDNDENNADDGQKWWDSESQNLLNSQQLVEALSMCDDLLQSQSPNRDGKNGEHKDQLGLSIYAHLGPDYLKKDIEECQNLALDVANTDDTPSEFRLSQLEFGSQDSFIAWGGSKAI
ncbi:unnamed protein product [Lupinus luteus]|uniref:NAC domain-containing protein n=1 Tax=Lupinus luteus TaxID=3873 RepID=A0AAV1WFT0_LUPLU